MNEPIAADVQKYPAHAAFTVQDCLGFGFGIDLGVGLGFGLEASFLAAISTNLQTHSLRIGVYTSILWFKLLTQIKSRQSNACHMSQFFEGMFFQNLKA